MKRILYIALFILFIAEGIYAQGDSSFTLLKTVPVKGVDFAVDNLNNIYVITDDQQLKKFNENGDSIAIYNKTRRYGKLESIDVSNPLKILLFYKDFSTVVVLDRYLAEKTSIDLRKLNIYQVSATGLSYDNNIWVFDVAEQKLKKLDEQGNILQETQDLRSVFHDVLKPVSILNRNNLVYLIDPENGIYMFDHYGSFQKVIPIMNQNNISIVGGSISGISNNRLTLYNPSTFTDRIIELPLQMKTFKRISITDERLFGLTSESIHIYSFDSKSIK